MRVSNNVHEFLELGRSAATYLNAMPSFVKPLNFCPSSSSYPVSFCHLISYVS